MADQGYSLELSIGATGDDVVKGRLKALEHFIEQTYRRGAALNKMRISPAVTIDDRISAPLRSVQANLDRTGGMFVKMFQSSGAGISESLKPVLDKIADWFDQTKEKVFFWKSSLIQSGKEAAESALSEFEKVFGNIRRKYLDNPEFKKLTFAGKAQFILNSVTSTVISSSSASSSGVFSGGQEKAGKSKKGIGETFWDKLGDNLSKEFGKLVPDAIDGLIGKIGQTGLGKKATQTFNKLPAPVKKVIGGVLTAGVKTVKETAGKWVSESVKDLFEQAKEAWPQAWQSTKNSAISIGNTALQKLGDFKIGDQSLRQRASGILESGKELYNDITQNRGGSLIQRVKDSAPGVFETVKDAAKSIGDAKIGNQSLREIGTGVLERGRGLFNEITEDGAGSLLKKSKNLVKRVPFIGKAVDLIDIATSEDKTKAVAKAAGGFGGAAAGAALGTLIFPGLGTLVGGVLGGLAGDWLAGIGVDITRSLAPKTMAETSAPFKRNDQVQPDDGLKQKPGEGGMPAAAHTIQNLTVNVTVNSQADVREIADEIAYRIAREVGNVVQNSVPQGYAYG